MRLRRLFFILSLLLWLVVTIITINSVSSAWSQFKQSKHGVNAIHQLRGLLYVTEMASRERGPANGVLGDDFPADPKKTELLSKARATTDQAIADLLLMLDENNEFIYINVLKARQNLHKARMAVDEQANLKRNQRDATKIRGAVNQMIGVVDDLSPSAISLTNDASASFPSTTDTLLAAIQAASLREYAGQLGSQLTATLTTRENLKIDELMVINHLRGRIEQLKEQLIARAVTLKQHKTVQAAIEIMTQRYFESAIPFVEEQIKMGLQDANYLVDTAQFAALYVPDMDSIVSLRDILINDAIVSAHKSLKDTSFSVFKTILSTALLFVLLLFNLWLLHHRVIRPLSKTTDLIVTIANGHLNVHIPSTRYKDEVNDMLRAIAVLRNNSIARQKAEETIRKMAFYDPLTELPNRRLLEDRLQQAMQDAKTNNKKCAVLFIDLDKFKAVNDDHGHEAGDWLLNEVANRMLLEIQKTDTAARIGGDEFIVLLPELIDNSQAFEIAENIRLQMEKPFVMEDGTKLMISSSIGVVIYPEHANNLHDLLRYGDEAMYAAKRQGRNEVVVFEGE